MSENESTGSQYNHPIVFRWNISDDYYQDGMRLYADGLLEINVGGYVSGRSLRNWFELQKENEEQSRLLGMSGEREATLLAEIEYLKNKIADKSFSTVVRQDALIAQQKAEIEKIKIENYTMAKETTEEQKEILRVHFKVDCEKDALLREQAKVIEELVRALRFFHEPENKQDCFPCKALESARKVMR